MLGCDDNNENVNSGDAGGAGAAGGAGGEGGAGATGGAGGQGGAGAAGGAGGQGGAGAAGGAGGQGGAGAAGGAGGQGGAGAAGGAGGVGGEMVPCLPEGGFGRAAQEGDDPEAACCDGLIRVPGTSPGVNGCFGEDGTYACTQCGNGECGLGENHCNCAADCEAPPECVPAGGEIPLDNPELQCCQGLFASECSRPTAAGACEMCPGGVSVCVNCGDGQCGEGESRCNCAIDCDDD
jgi:hypothetical protein